MVYTINSNDVNTETARSNEIGYNSLNSTFIQKIMGFAFLIQNIHCGYSQMIKRNIRIFQLFYFSSIFTGSEHSILIMHGHSGIAGCLFRT